MIKLAVACGAGFIVTNYVADLTGGELRFPEIRVVRRLEFMKEAI